MLSQILTGGVVSIGNITIHAFLTVLVVDFARYLSARPTSHPSLMLSGMMIGTASILMAAHSCEVLLWALAYFILGAAPDDAGLVYFAFVNYTTLGYGDVLPNPDWRLLGPMTAMNGVLLFGWSTALMFEVLRRILPAARRKATQRGRPTNGKAGQFRRARDD